MLPRPGDLIAGKYRILRLIGEGGMGAVFEARHEHLGAIVALKFLLPEFAKRTGLVARFLQEARVAASIKSPHVTQVVDVDQLPDGSPYFVMELLEGESLERRFGRGLPVPLPEALAIARQMLEALAVAHARGVVHRDLKPDNVWLVNGPTGVWVKLLDFGIAKLRSATEFLEVATAPGSMMGTPEYMAPEQAISADQVDARADLYSFGVIVFEMLGGVRPVETSDLHEIITRLARGQYRSLGSLRPDLPPALVALVDRLVQPDPDKRPSSAAAVRAELDSAVAPGPSNYPGARQSYPVIAATVPPQDRSAPAALASTNLAPPSANAGFVQSRTAAIPAQGFAQGGTAAIPAQGFAQGGTAAIAAPGFAHGGTAAMPRAASGGAAPGSVPGTVSFAQAPPAGRVSVPQVPAFVPGRRRRSRVGIFLLLFLPVSAAAGVGVWLWFNPSVLSDDPLPPMPGPAPSVAAPPPLIAPDVEPVIVPRGSEPRRPRSNVPDTASTSPTAPQLPSLPTTMPSSLIPPGLIPSALMQYLPPFLTPKPASQETPGAAQQPAQQPAQEPQVVPVPPSDPAASPQPGNNQ